MAKIDCPALSEDGTRCQADLGPCPTGELIGHFVRGKPVPEKRLIQIEQKEVRKRMQSDVFTDIDRPGKPEFPESKGRCPLCSTCMEGNNIVYRDKLPYTFDYTFYCCNNHHHGYFVWQGGERGHVRPIFPDILKRARYVGQKVPQSRDIPEMATIICPDCGFKWEEFKTPAREDTICPDCRRRLDFPTDNMASSGKKQKTLTDF